MAAKVKGLQEWCKRQCEGYRDVNITNMTSSWKSGLAFCAIIHRYRPDLIDYNSLSKENVYENNKLAFTVGETIGIPALLDAEDMVAMAVPDKLCIITYVAQYYNVFRDKNPAGGPSKAVQAVKRPSAGVPPSRPPETKRPVQKELQIAETNGASQKSGAALGRRGTYGENCHMCGGKVYLLERHIDGNTLYHRHCFRTSQRTQPKPSSYITNLHGRDVTSNGRGNETAGLFETQANKGYKQDSAAKVTNKSLITNISTQSPRGPSPVRNHPYHRQPTTENKVDKIAELFNEKESAFNKTTSSSKNLLLLGYSSNAYKPTESSSEISSSVSKTDYGAHPVLKAETKASTGTVTTNTDDKREDRMMSRSKSPVSANAGTCVALQGRPKTSPVENKKDVLPTDSSTCDKNPDSNVVSGLLQSLTHIRNNDNKINLKTTKLNSQGTSNSAPSRTARSGANAHINPNRRYLQIKSPDQNVPKAPTTVSSEASITKHSSSTSDTGSVTLTKAKVYIPDKTIKTSPVSITTKLKHSTDSSVISSQEKKPDLLLHNDTTTKKPKSILKIPKAEPRIQTDDFEIDWTTPDPTLKEIGNSVPPPFKAPPKKSEFQTRKITEFPVAPPRKFILKNKEGPKPSNESASTNGNNSRSMSPTTEINTFKLKDSIEMSQKQPPTVGSKNAKNELQKVEIEIRNKEESTKPEWMLEAEKRQKMRGGKYIDPEKKWKTDIDTSNSKSTNVISNVTSRGSPAKQPGPRIKETINTRAPEKWVSPNNRKKSELSVQNNAKPDSETVPSQKLVQSSQNGKKEGVAENKPEWMREAERRIAERNGQYKDPEKKQRGDINDSYDGRATSPSISPPGYRTSPGTSPKVSDSPRSAVVSPNSHSATAHSPDRFFNNVSPLSGEDNTAVSPRHKKRPAPPRPSVPPYSVSPTNKPNISPGRRLVPASLQLNPQPLLNSPERKPLKKISVEEEFQFSSFEASADWDAINFKDNSPGQRSPIYYPPERESPVPPPVPPKNFGDEELTPTSSKIHQIQSRPLPSPPLRSPGCDGCDATKRTVQAESRLSLTDMAIQLEELDKQLQILEGEGRILEDKIRSESEEAMDEDELMIQWFELVNAKNDLVRKEADLMYQQRQQELEVLHEELEYDLRCLMNKPDYQKTSSEKVREASLLQELLDTVSQRNLIVDSMEEDRIRYLEEDEVIASMMANKGFSKDAPKGKNGKNRKNKRDKKKKS